MKSLKTIATWIFCIGFLFSVTSCTVVFFKKDNGKHKGWYKNPNNPHHPNNQNHPNDEHHPAEPHQGKSKDKTKE